MNTSLVCVVLALSSASALPNSADESVGPTSTRFANGQPPGLLDELLVRKVIIRGQSPAYRVADGSREVESGPIVPAPAPYVAPTFVNSPQQIPTFESQPGSSPASAPYEPETTTTPPLNLPMQTSPFMTLQVPGTIPGASTWGANGPQPYRLGYSLWGDVGYLPRSSVDVPGVGKLGVMEANMGLTHTVPTGFDPWLFTLEHQLGYRSWDGPTSVPAKFIDLPASVYRIGWDMRLETPLNSPFSPFAASLAFNPSINSDFDQKLGREAINFDGRGIVFWQADPHLLIGVGAQFWDRVTDRVIPYAGFVWLPDDRWEFRIMWPQSRISWYLGNVMGNDLWVYASGEYHIESYEIGSSTFVAAPPPGTIVSRDDQIELEDYRILFGLRKSNSWKSAFIEGGVVFGRHADQRFGPSFHINEGFIGRIGIRF